MHTLDNLVFLWFNATATSPAWLVPLARFASLEVPQWLVAGTVGALVVGDAATRRMLLRVLVAMLAAWLLARLGQHVFSVQRPFALGLGTAWLPHGDSPGFPSTHASVAFGFAFALAAGAPGHRTLVQVAAFGVACLIGWSRVCLGLHFPSDILVGMGIGGIAAWMAAMLPVAAPRLRVAHD